MRQYLNTTGKLVLFPLTLSLMWVSPTIAQIVPDGTLGAESSIVTPLDALGDRIDGGAIRGSNLFHSFQDFNIDDGRGAFFSNPAGIENILTRITGSNPSNIFGTLGVLGNANLFLINPNGIVFGPNARLDVGGSFFASTAEGINFLGGYQFSATNPDVPPLLTINVPIGLQFGANPGGIVNQSVATNEAGEVRGLEVPSGETLALVGGNVTLDGGSIQARGGRVELGGLAGLGTVGVNADGSLSFPDGLERADVSLANDAEVNVRAGGGGEISIRARNFEMSGISKLRAGIADGMGVPESQAGDINIDATGAVALFDGSFVSNTIRETAIGNGGDVNVTSQTLSLTGNAERPSQINTLVEGQGNGGVVKIRTADTTTLNRGSIISSLEGLSGSIGGVDITASFLTMVNNSIIGSSSFGQGNSGFIKIQVADTITLDASTISNEISDDAVGNGGKIEIITGSFFLSNDAAISSGLSAIGNNGSTDIRVRDTIAVDNSNIFNQITDNAVGNAGDININTRSLFLTHGSQIGSGTFGMGNAGNIRINAAGTIFIDGSGVSPDGILSFSGITASLNEGAIGKGGNVEIVANSVSLSNGAFLSTTTSGQGDAGRLAIEAETVTFDSGSEVENQIAATGIGNSGGIEIVTDSLFLNNGSSFVATTFGQGNGGKITIRAADTVVLDGIAFEPTNTSSINTQVGENAIGNSPGIDITTESLILRNATLFTSTIGRGYAGKINIHAADIVAENSSISSDILPGAVGNSQGIEIKTSSLSFFNSPIGNGGFVGGVGNAGNFSIQATDSVSLENSSIATNVGQTGIGNGGNIIITARTLSLNNSGLFTDTQGQGNAGNISVKVTDSVVVTGSPGGFLAAVSDEAVGQGGDIDIETSHLFLGRGTGIFANTDGQGDAGQVTIRDADTVTLDGSFISTSALENAQGIAQGIDITTDRLSLSNGASINAATSGRGDAGQVVIRATDAITLDRGEISSSAFSSAVGNALGVEITTNNLSLSNGAFIDAVSDNSNGNAGKIELEANRIDLDRSFINASTLGGEGNINLRSQELVLRNNSRIRTDAFGTATGGNITLNSDVIATLENSDISANAQDAFGGRVTIDTQGLFGTAFRERLTPQSDITATSALGPDFSGTVEITPPEVDPASGLVSLPESPVDAASLFGKDFCSQRGTSQFIFTGRGGIPPSPFDPLGGSSPIELDWVEAVDSPEVEEPESRDIPSPVARPLIEAQGWVVAADGTIVLTAQPYRGTPAPPALSHPDCQHLNINTQ